MSKTYRFQFTDEVMESITGFAKVHEHDHRKDYKKAWNIWIEDNYEMLSAERRRLTDIGYTGNIDDKMYKAGRYYFRTKITTKIEPKERSAYIQMAPELVEAMDTHIKASAKFDNYTPASGYNEFCNSNIMLLKKTIYDICSANNSIDSKKMSEKIKKTYKNRYFLYKKSNT